MMTVRPHEGRRASMRGACNLEAGPMRCVPSIMPGKAKAALDISRPLPPPSYLSGRAACESTSSPASGGHRPRAILATSAKVIEIRRLSFVVPFVPIPERPRESIRPPQNTRSCRTFSCTLAAMLRTAGAARRHQSRLRQGGALLGIVRLIERGAGKGDGQRPRREPRRGGRMMIFDSVSGVPAGRTAYRVKFATEAWQRSEAAALAAAGVCGGNKASSQATIATTSMPARSRVANSSLGVAPHNDVGRHRCASTRKSRACGGVRASPRRPPTTPNRGASGSALIPTAGCSPNARGLTRFYFLRLRSTPSEEPRTRCCSPLTGALEEPSARPPHPCHAGRSSPTTRRSPTHDGRLPCRCQTGRGRTSWRVHGP